MNRNGVPPAIRARLAGALTVWSVVWGLSVGAAVWLAAAHEVDELLDDALQSSAELVSVLVRAPQARGLPGGAVELVSGGSGGERFAWQVVARDGTLELRSPRAPSTPWRSTPTAGFGDEEHWRIYGLPLGADGRTLYAAQTRDERREARAEVALGAVLAALAVGMVGHLWLRSRVRAELQPLQTLSDRLANWDLDPARGSALTLGPAERRELQPVHEALEALTTRLLARIASEQAFSAHAAHALRTPLAGIDTQLAVALRECPAPLQERLQRVRGAASRLQGVVVALLGLFRSGAQAQQRVTIDVAQMLQRLPAPGLQLHVAAGARIDGDPDLLAAALLNLVDNAQRHGAANVWVDTPSPHTLRLRDDGPGITPQRRGQLQQALDTQATEGVTGLGLMLADRVARAHGGRLRLLETPSGFAAEMELMELAETDHGMAWFRG